MRYDRILLSSCHSCSLSSDAAFFFSMLKYLADFRLFFITPVFLQVNSLIQWSSTGTAVNQVKHARRSLEMYYCLYHLLSPREAHLRPLLAMPLVKTPRALANFPSVCVVVL